VAARNAIGLDIGTSGVRAAELSFGRHGVTLEKFGQVAVPAGSVRDGEVVDQAAVSEAIRELWSATKFSRKDVVLGIANQRVVVRSVEVQWLPAAELRRSLPLQVADQLPMPVSEAVLDFHPLEEIHSPRGRMLRGLLVAAVRESLLGNVRCVERAGSGLPRST
jgi:type IV pilus assembly protein PilM